MRTRMKLLYGLLIVVGVSISLSVSIARSLPDRFTNTTLDWTNASPGSATYTSTLSRKVIVNSVRELSDKEAQARDLSLFGKPYWVSATDKESSVSLNWKVVCDYEILPPKTGLVDYQTTGLVDTIDVLDKQQNSGLLPSATPGQICATHAARVETWIPVGVLPVSQLFFAKGFMTFFMWLFVWIACLLLGGYLWLLPIFIARRRKHPNLVPLAIVDLAFGWSGVAWILCLAWAFQKVPASTTEAA